MTHSNPSATHIGMCTTHDMDYDQPTTQRRLRITCNVCMNDVCVCECVYRPIIISNASGDTSAARELCMNQIPSTECITQCVLNYCTHQVNRCVYARRTHMHGTFNTIKSNLRAHTHIRSVAAEEKQHTYISLHSFTISITMLL